MKRQKESISCLLRSEVTQLKAWCSYSGAELVSSSDMQQCLGPGGRVPVPLRNNGVAPVR